MMRALGALAIVVGLGFGAAAGYIAAFGTGVALPTGPSAVEGELSPGPLVEVPAGAPLLYGEVKLTRPGSQAMEPSWSQPVGSAEVTVRTANGEVTARLPPPDRWRGEVPVDSREGVESLEGLPVVGEVADEARARLRPPFVVLVRGLRPGDAIVATRDGDVLRDVYVGERATLEAWIQQCEQGRWPVVVLLSVMAVVSIALGTRGLRRR